MPQTWRNYWATSRQSNHKSKKNKIKGKNKRKKRNITSGKMQKKVRLLGKPCYRTWSHSPPSQLRKKNNTRITVFKKKNAKNSLTFFLPRSCVLYALAKLPLHTQVLQALQSYRCSAPSARRLVASAVGLPRHHTWQLTNTWANLRKLIKGSDARQKKGAGKRKELAKESHRSKEDARTKGRKQRVVTSVLNVLKVLTKAKRKQVKWK